MLMCGVFLLMIAVWQFYSLKQHRRQFVGLKKESPA